MSQFPHFDLKVRPNTHLGENADAVRALGARVSVGRGHQVAFEHVGVGDVIHLKRVVHLHQHRLARHLVVVVAVAVAVPVVVVVVLAARGGGGGQI